MFIMSIQSNIYQDYIKYNNNTNPQTYPDTYKYINICKFHGAHVYNQIQQFDIFIRICSYNSLTYLRYTLHTLSNVYKQLFFSLVFTELV